MNPPFLENMCNLETPKGLLLLLLLLLLLQKGAASFKRGMF